MIDLGDLMADDKMDELFFIHNIQHLEGAALHDIARAWFNIGCKDIIRAVMLPEFSYQIGTDLPCSANDHDFIHKNW